MIVHVSAINEWQKCKRRWMMGDRNNGLGYTPRLPADPLLLGTWIHEAMYQHYNNGLMLEHAYDETVHASLAEYMPYLKSPKVSDRIAKLTGLGRGMLEGYRRWQDQDTSRYADRNIEFLAAEQGFIVDFEGHTITGTWDGIVEHRTEGWHMVFESKTTTNLQILTEGVNYDWQNRLYSWAAGRVLEIPVTGVLYNILRKQNPYDVKLLANGLPSTSKVELEKTTFAVYAELLAKSGVAWGQKHADALQSLKGNQAGFFSRFPQRVTAGQEANFENQLRQILIEMERDRDLGEDVLPTLNRYDCVRWCPFMDACLAKDDNADWRGYLDDTMIQRKKEVI